MMFAITVLRAAAISCLISRRIAVVTFVSRLILLSGGFSDSAKMEGDEMFDDQMDILQKIRRRQAIAERRVKGIKFVIGSKPNDPNSKVKSSLKGLRHEVVDKEPEQNEQEKEMSSVMGFAKFGHQKHVPQNTSSNIQIHSDIIPKSLPQSRTFDIDQLVQQSIQTARQTCGGTSDAAPAVPAGETVSDPLPGPAADSDEDDEDFVGPPLPPAVTELPDSSDLLSHSRGDRESDSSECDEDEDSSDRYSRLPVTSEISLQHGSKNISALAGM